MTNRHFGRISEVWKHLVLAEVLASERPGALLDTHAGDAVYPVVDDPERVYGVLAFADLVDDAPTLRDSAYAEVLSSLRSGSTLDGIPGGPLVAMEVLGQDAEYLFCDLDPDSAANIRDAAAGRGVRSARVLTADGMGSVHAALADRNPADVVVFIDPFDHHLAGPSGLSALDVGVEAARAGAVLVYWYGYDRIDRRHWIVDELVPRDVDVDWWCGDVMVSAEGADMTAGDLGAASTPGTGSGLVCINASAATIERCTALGSALSAVYRDRPLPSGGAGSLDFVSLGSPVGPRPARRARQKGPVMDLPRIFTIRESSHRIHNPLTEVKLAELGGALQLAPGTRALDLASGSGEMLCTWARDHGITGTGVDISTVFTEQARARAAELGVADRVTFVHDDASGYVAAQPVDLAACVGATWIGGGVAGTAELLDRSLRPGGIMLIGEPYWRRTPPDEETAQACHASSIADFLLLPDLIEQFQGLGYDVVEMVLANEDSWDRYAAAQWLNMRRWLDQNPHDELAPEVREELTSEPVRYAASTREHLGWGVFALMKR